MTALWQLTIGLAPDFYPRAVPLDCELSKLMFLIWWAFVRSALLLYSMDFGLEPFRSLLDRSDSEENQWAGLLAGDEI
jgi:hypothetical protein